MQPLNNIIHAIDFWNYVQYVILYWASPERAEVAMNSEGAD
jgi:hypothetical protein